MKPGIADTRQVQAATPRSEPRSGSPPAYTTPTRRRPEAFQLISNLPHASRVGHADPPSAGLSGLFAAAGADGGCVYKPGHGNSGFTTTGGRSNHGDGGVRCLRALPRKWGCISIGKESKLAPPLYHARPGYPTVVRGPLMVEPAIICQSCNTEITLKESLAAPLLESTRRKYEKCLAHTEAS